MVPSQALNHSLMQRNHGNQGVYCDLCDAFFQVGILP